MSHNGGRNGRSAYYKILLMHLFLRIHLTMPILLCWRMRMYNIRKSGAVKNPSKNVF